MDNLFRHYGICMYVSRMALSGGGLEVSRDYGLKDLVSLGGFENFRREYDFQGFKLELDETKYAWGTVHEIEIETVS
jgi:CYTH domain